MDSQLTLVAPQGQYLVESGVPQPTPASTLLFFSTDSVSKATISTYTGDLSEIIYVIDTNLNMTRTTVARYPGAPPFVILQRREFLSDKISINGQEAIKVSKLLKSVKRSSVFPMTFEEKGQTYIWDASMVGQLSLYIPTQPDTPIAWFQRSRKLLLNGKPTILPAYLILEPEAVEIQDMVVITFLLAEQKARVDPSNAGAAAALRGMAAAGG